MSSPDSEDALEQAIIEVFLSLGYEHANLYHETFGEDASHGRDTSREVIFSPILNDALVNLNPDLPKEAYFLALEEMKRDRSAMNPVLANQEVYSFLKNGVPVSWVNDDQEEVRERLRVIDWENPSNNDFFLAQQMWVSGDLYQKRCDIVGCINGIPLVFIELKKPGVNVRHAYDDNLRDYKNNTIPQLWWYNAFIILSNGTDSRLGSMTSEWEHFFEWKKISSEGEKGVISLDTMIKGTCEPSRLINMIENFLLYMEVPGGLAKIVAKNHQFLGVQNAVQAVKELEQNAGRLGVFWHTQGSGKSLSMVFFCQYVMRKVPGNWTFLIVTDRKELDKQIYKTFAGCGLVQEKHCRATSGDNLKTLLREDHQFVFSLIQKFQANDGSKYPELSDRKDVIVITDEAHRSQYDTLAMNMRIALPNAAFIGFTGTPLIAGEERTKEVFGDYVSVYNFKQSVEDNATVPLYYENRIPELQLINEDLNTEIEELLENAELDEDQELKLERTFTREYHLITREERLNTIAEDLVDHFLGRGVMGKAMVVSIDRFTAVRMYNKVKSVWAERLSSYKQDFDYAQTDAHDALRKRIKFMEETDMAVVISSAQNEQSEFEKRGLTILPHRERIAKEDLEQSFKDPDSPLRIVFVCAMWLTGFDVPSCSTLYLDKPMKNHTLMQTIARANRVFPEKNNGLIVDYVGIFRNLQKALAIYGPASGGGVKPGDSPVEDKEELLTMLRSAVAEVSEWCQSKGVNVQEILPLPTLERIKAYKDAAEKLIYPNEDKKEFINKVNLFVRIHKAVMPDPVAHEFDAFRSAITSIRDMLKPDSSQISIDGVLSDVEDILDDAIGINGYVIKGSGSGEVAETGAKVLDLSQIDFEQLKSYFNKGRRRTSVEKLRVAIEKQLSVMVNFNRTRIDFLEKFSKMIDEYNSGSRNIEDFFEDLKDFVHAMNEEDQRAVREGLSEEELSLFDILTKPEMKMSEKDRKKVKLVSKALLESLKKEKLVLDWKKKQQTRAGVKLTIETILDELPRSYTPEIWQKKCDMVFQHIFDHYQDMEHSTFATVG